MSCFFSIRRQHLQRAAILALIAATTAGLALLLSERRVEAAQDAGLRQFGAAVHDFFSPPRRHGRRTHKRTTVGASREARRDATETREPEQAAMEEQSARRGRSSRARASGARASAQFVPPDAAPMPRPRPFEAPNPRRELAQTAPSIDARRATRDQGGEQADALPGRRKSSPPTKAAAPAKETTAKESAPPKPSAPAKESVEKTEAPQAVSEEAAPAGPSACQMRLSPDLAS